jgi:hypothetical protein
VREIMSDTIQSAEAFAVEVLAIFSEACTPGYRFFGATTKAQPGINDAAKVVESRDAAIRADEARKQAQRCAACVEALKNVSEAEQSVAYQKTGFSEQLAILSMLRQCGEIARKALADLEATK